MEGEMTWCEETCMPAEGSEDSNGEEAFEAPSNNGSDDDEEEVEEDGEQAVGGGGRARARWWEDSLVHPNGTKNWKDLPNLLAAEAYDCRCGKKCLTALRAKRAHISREARNTVPVTMFTMFTMFRLTLREPT